MTVYTILLLSGAICAIQTVLNTLLAVILYRMIKKGPERDRD